MQAYGVSHFENLTVLNPRCTCLPTGRLGALLHGEPAVVPRPPPLSRTHSFSGKAHEEFCVRGYVRHKRLMWYSFRAQFLHCVVLVAATVELKPSSCILKGNPPIAQLVEQEPFKFEVVGSIPTGRTNHNSPRLRSAPQTVLRLSCSVSCREASGSRQPFAR